MKQSGLLYTLSILLLCLSVHTAVLAQLQTNNSGLQQAARVQADKETENFRKLLKLSQEKGWKMMFTTRSGNVARLEGVDVAGNPIYVTTINNINSAATIQTNQLWQGGSTGLNLSGSSASVKGKLGIWDDGRVRSTHVEMVNRILQKGTTTTNGDHATHVAGTMIASGVNPLAKGMAYGVQQLIAYSEFSNDVSGMLAEAPGLLVSNHSYATVAGWQYNATESHWEFYGDPNATEDYKFGFYINKSQLYDSIAYNAPYYLIVLAGGNNRNENGPAVGQPYWRYNASGQMANAGNRPAGISSNNGYDITPASATAKNVLTVGAANSLPTGYSKPADVVLGSFSSWGPTDDGRIKPDVVADGINVTSTISTSDNAYATYSGTSMAAPSVSGSALLLQEYYAKLHSGSFMYSATLKGLIIHTADEAGAYPGPDYQYGWGLVNMVKAAAVITSNNTDQQIYQNNLTNGTSYSLPLVASGKGSVVATICWTDVKGTVDDVNRLNNRTKKLVNDLDIRIKRGSTVYQPWVLDPNNPANAATKGDNNTDNVERIEITDVVPGEQDTIIITHKGTLARGQQAYSLIVSGVGGQAYCASAPSSNTGARIDNVTIGTAVFNNPAGCTSYTNNTGTAVQAEPLQALPLTVKASSCDATSVTKTVKAFIDINNDGDFTDAGETLATGTITGSNTLNSTITIPAGIPVGNTARLRIVMQETATASDVTSCGAYTKGETQDYRITVIAASNDVGATELVYPTSAGCANGAQLVSVRIKNFGSLFKKGVPITTTIKNSSGTTVATLTATYPDTIAANSDVVYTYQTPFNEAAGDTYTFTTTTNLTGDQITSNNQNTTSLTIGNAATPSGSAEICSATQVALKAAVNNSSDVPLWYSTANATTPVASGANATSNVITANKTYYLALNDLSLSVGATGKQAYSSGGYNSYSGNFVRFNNTVPVTIESAKLYIGFPGKITFTVADIYGFNSQTGAYNYVPISSTTINAYATTPTPQAGSTGNNAADAGAVFYLNLPVPTPGNHVIIVDCQSQATIFRNSGITTNPYPFSVSNVFSITGNSATNTTDTTNTNYFQQFYYFLYDLKVKTGNCPSSRVPVVATNAAAPVISLSSNIFTSTLASGNQWYVNDTLITGATAQTYTAARAGVYKVVATTAAGCVLASNTITFSATPVIDLNGAAIALVASPNPNRGRFQLQFEVKGKDDLVLSLVNGLGQTVYKKTYPGFSGKFSQQIDAGKPGSGVYVLKIEHNNKTYIKKLLVE